jgi:hypothetical protein
MLVYFKSLSVQMLVYFKSLSLQMLVYFKSLSVHVLVYFKSLSLQMLVYFKSFSLQMFVRTPQNAHTQVIKDAAQHPKPCILHPIPHNTHRWSKMQQRRRVITKFGLPRKAMVFFQKKVAHTPRRFISHAKQLCPLFLFYFFIFSKIPSCQKCVFTTRGLGLVCRV